MTITLTSREFNRNPSAAKRAAEKEPVIITDRGRPRFVLVEYDAYEAARQAAAASGRSIADCLADLRGPDIDFEPPRLDGPYMRPVDFD
jgi:prevent-host-death family protein